MCSYDAQKDRSIERYLERKIRDDMAAKLEILEGLPINEQLTHTIQDMANEVLSKRNLRYGEAKLHIGDIHLHPDTSSVTINLGDVFNQLGIPPELIEKEKPAIDPSKPSWPLRSNKEFFSKSRPTLTSRYGEDIGNWLNNTLYELIDKYGDCCHDNHRIADVRKPEEVKIYEDHKSEGCCGYYDTTVEYEGRRYMIGFNYGH